MVQAWDSPSPMRSPTTSVVKSRFTAAPTPEAPSPFSSPWLQTPPARTEAALFSLYLRYSSRFSGFEGRICVGSMASVDSPPSLRTVLPLYEPISTSASKELISRQAWPGGALTSSLDPGEDRAGSGLVLRGRGECS